MISCKQASLLMSKAMDEPLSLGEKMSLKMHLAACELCRMFDEHLVSIRKGMQKLFGHGETVGNETAGKLPSEILAEVPQPSSTDECLTLETKERMKRKISGGL